MSASSPRDGTVAPPPAARPRSRGLAHGLVDDLSRRIRERSLMPTHRLPTEAEIAQSYGVSRTVVREALSRLQAAGLVETRHGIGTFVLPPRPSSMFRLGPAELATSIDVLAMLELRIGVETEAAGLAAQRRSDQQLAQMREALASFEAQVAASSDAAGADFLFHRRIAEATGNPYFADIMEHLGTALIPRTRIDTSRHVEHRAAYSARVHREHEEIQAAIARGDAESARAAMRIHLTNSRERLRLRLEAARSGAAGGPSKKAGRRPAPCPVSYEV